MKKRFLLFIMVLLLMSTLSPIKANAENSIGWTKRADLPEERINAGVGVVDGKIFVFGGASEKNKLNNQTFMYDPKKDVWEEKASMPRNRTGGTYATVGKKIYLIGGINEETGVAYNTIDIYDAELDQWAEEPIQIPREPVFSAYSKGTLQAVVVKEKIYIVSSKNSYKNNVYEYNTVSGEWKSLNSSGLPSRNGRAISAIDGKIYVAGGENSIGHSREKYLFQYDIATDTWKRLIDVQLTSYTYEPSYETYNGKFFIIGGQLYGDSSKNMVNKVQIFDPQDGQFKNSAYELPEGRVSAVAAIVDDQLYVIGGRDYPYSMRNLSVKSDYRSVISISLKDLQVTEDEKKPDDGIAEDPKDQDGTKPGDGTTEEPKDQDGTKPGDDTTEEPKDQDGTKPGDGTTEEPKDQDGTKPGDGTTEEPKDQDGTKPGEETAKGILSITMINGLQKDYLLSMKEINDFLNWYKERSFGIGMNFYEINDEHNKGPFTSKKDYVVYQNILMFDIKQY
ncbi:Kelch repeat-containing protein [Bacillus altitudinis]|uniref:Kelch repeat-containing protein n=1 Tax=Bacillus altitudinis TaxID=293387 RepID=UPI0030C843B0